MQQSGSGKPASHLQQTKPVVSGRTVHVAAALLLPHQPRFSEVLQSPACSNSPRIGGSVGFELGSFGFRRKNEFGGL